MVAKGFIPRAYSKVQIVRAGMGISVIERIHFTL